MQIIATVTAPSSAKALALGFVGLAVRLADTKASIGRVSNCKANGDNELTFTCKINDLTTIHRIEDGGLPFLVQSYVMMDGERVPESVMLTEEVPSGMGRITFA